MPEDVKPVGELKPYTPNIKPVGELKPYNHAVSSPEIESDDKYDIISPSQSGLDKFEEVLTNIPDINEAQRSNLRKLSVNVKLGKATHEDLRDAILVYQNKHPKQEESGKYYLTENFAAKPLGESERPPKGYDVANDYWGTQEEADKKGFLKSAGSHLYNGVLKGVLGLEGLINLPYALTTGEDADWYKSAQNRVESSLMKTPEYEREQQFFDSKDMQGIADFFDSDRYNLNANAVQGAALSGLESVVSFLVGTKGLGAAGKIAGSFAEGAGALKAGSIIGTEGQLLQQGSKLTDAIKGTSAIGQKAQAFGGAYAISLPEVLDYLEENGIEGTEKYRLGAAITIPFALTEMIGGTEGLFVKNATAKAAKSAAIKGVVDAVKRNVDGPLTKEYLADVFKATTKEAAILNKSFAREVGETMVSEGLTEGLQEFEKRGLAELYDHISGEDNFKKNPMSLEAFGDYYNSVLTGAAGAFGPSLPGVVQKRKLEVQEKQSSNLYNVVKSGEESVNALKLNVDKAVSDGEITAEQGAELVFKLDAYNTYNSQTKELGLTDEDNKRVFELTFEKANLESQIPSEYEQKKLNAIEQAKINAKEQQAKEIQKEIDAIIQKNEVLNKTTTAAKKTVEKVDEELQPEEQIEGEAKVSQTLKDLAAKYRGEGEAEIKAEKPKKVVDERPFEQIPPLDWNTKRASEKFNILKNKLEKDNDTVAGNLRLEFGGEGRTTSDVINVELPGKKFVVTASSAKDLVTQLRGHFKTEFVKGDIENLPVVVKPIQLTSGKTVLGIYNEDNGRFISYVREHDTGKSKYSEKEVEELQHMQAVSRLTKSEIDYYKQKRNLPPEEGEAGALMVPTTPVTPQTPSGETIQIDETETTGPVRENLPSSEKVGAKGEKKAKVTTEEARNIKNAVNAKPNTFEEAVLRYFLHKGKINTKDFKRYTGFGVKDERTNKVKGGKEFKSYIWSYKNDAPSIDNLVGRLWTEDMEMGEEYNEQALINEFFEILKVTPGLRTALSSLLDSKKRTIETSEQYASPEAIAYAEQLDEEEKLINTRDLTDEEIQDLLAKEEYAKEYDEYYAQRFEEDKGYERYPEEQKSSEGANIEDIKRVVERMKEVMPKINITYNDKIPVAGVLLADGKGIEINPYRAGIDTPIHEVGHILISAMRNDSAESKAVIDAATEQLKGTDLWNEIAERYPELSEEELGDEVLAEAIGREGEGIFETEMEKSKFMQYLEYIFNWIKQKLGVDKNIAKSLAQQIIAGIRTKGYEYEGTERQQKEKGKKKKLWDMNKEEREAFFNKYKKKPLSFNDYKEIKYGKLNDEFYADVRDVYTLLENENLSEAEREYANNLLNKLKRIEDEKWRDYTAYLSDLKTAQSISEELGDSEIDEETRIKLMNELHGLEKIASEQYLNDAKLKYAKHYFDEQTIKLSENEKFIYEKALKGDLSEIDVAMKVLSHMPESVPELQKLSTVFRTTNFDKVVEAEKLKTTYEKLGQAVIEEVNKKLGITGKAKSFISSDSAKYFEYMENPKGIEVADKDGNITYKPALYTLEEAKAKGFSKAQIDFLKFNRDLIEQYQKEIDKGFNPDFEALKVDPSLSETFKADGMMSALSQFLGSSYNLRQVRISFDNPNTNKTEIKNFADIEKEIVKYGNKGPKEKLKALGLLIKYNARARKQLKQGINVDENVNPLEIKHGGEYSLNYEGRLIGKFDRPRDKNRGYSRDFYRAGIEFIDDFMHVKHMSKIMPAVNSIEYMAQKGYNDPLTNTVISPKKNAAKWVDEWRRMHLFKAEKETDPILDSSLKFLRKMASMTSIMFSVPSAAWNLFMGVYSNWRQENMNKLIDGNKRLFGEAGKHKVNKDYAYGLLNPYAVDIVRKYKAVSTDADSNPRKYIGKLFSMLGYGLTSAAEFEIQASMFLGLMTEEEYNSFEYKKDQYGIDQLVVKPGVDEKALQEKLLSYRTRVSDIQGKYATEDRRNIMNSEWGKNVFQFRVWIPDWWKERYGAEYITADGELKRGTWRDFTNDAFKELRQYVNDEGVWKALLLGKPEKEMPLAAKNFMSNIKGLAMVGLALSLKFAGDDDKKKRDKSALIDQALGNLLFIFDPETAKFTISKPFAGIGVVNNLIDVVEEAIELDGEGFVKKSTKLLPGNKLYRQIEDLAKD